MEAKRITLFVSLDEGYVKFKCHLDLFGNLLGLCIKHGEIV